jgi:hypothetical protein
MVREEWKKEMGGRNMVLGRGRVGKRNRVLE